MPAFSMPSHQQQQQMYSAARPSPPHNSGSHRHAADEAPDVEAMRLALSQLSRELDGCLCRLEESGQEKELLVAERTQLVIRLQVGGRGESRNEQIT